jgi:hypothetical protein
MAEQRQDTKLESEGAEFLVLGNLLVEGISCFKAYVNFPGYDLVAVNPDNSHTARIQVKSRWATNYDRSFPIKNFDCEFVVHVALNRVYRFGKTPKNGETGIKDPVFYIFPTAVVREAQNAGDKWGKVTITNIPDFESYRNNWALIARHLGMQVQPNFANEKLGLEALIARESSKRLAELGGTEKELVQVSRRKKSLKKSNWLSGRRKL